MRRLSICNAWRACENIQGILEKQSDEPITGNNDLLVMEVREGFN